MGCPFNPSNYLALIAWRLLRAAGYLLVLPARVLSPTGSYKKYLQAHNSHGLDCTSAILVFSAGVEPAIPPYQGGVLPVKLTKQIGSAYWTRTNNLSLIKRVLHH